jgi:hypothetical protein
LRPGKPFGEFMTAWAEAAPRKRAMAAMDAEVDLMVLFDCVLRNERVWGFSICCLKSTEFWCVVRFRMWLLEGELRVMCRTRNQPCATYLFKIGEMMLRMFRESRKLEG